MEKLLFFALVLFFYFSNPALGQDEMKKTEIIPYNQEIGDWDVVFSLPENFPIEGVTEAWIVINGQVEYVAVATERGIEFSHTEEIKFYAGEKYFFKPFFLYDKKWHSMPGMEYLVPEISQSLTWKIKDLYLKTEVMFSEYPGLFPDTENSYFSVIDSDTDSIIYGDVERIPIERSDGNKFFGMKELTSVGLEKEQYLNSVVAFSNQYGEVKLYSLGISRFQVGGDFTISTNVVGVGAITLFWEDNIPKQMEIISLETGQIVQKKEVIAGESFWIDTRPGHYLIRLDNLGQKRIIKI